MARRTKLEELQDTRTILRGAAPHAAQYLRDIISRKVKKPSWVRIRCAEYVIDHIIGKAPQRHEIGGVDGKALTLLELAILAEAEALRLIGAPPAALNPPAPPENTGGADVPDVIDVKVLDEKEDTPKDADKTSHDKVLSA